MLFRGSDRQHQPSAGHELLDQRRRHAGRHCGQQHAVEGRGGRQPEIAVGMLKTHIGNFQFTQLEPRLFEQRRNPLDTEHFLAKLRQHRGLIAASGADLENLVRRPPGEQ